MQIHMPEIWTQIRTSQRDPEKGNEGKSEHLKGGSREHVGQFVLVKVMVWFQYVAVFASDGKTTLFESDVHQGPLGECREDPSVTKLTHIHHTGHVQHTTQCSYFHISEVGVNPCFQTFLFFHLFWLCPFITIMHWYVGVLSVGGSRLLVSRSQGPHPFLLHDHVLQLRASHLSKQWRKVVLNSP